MFIYLLSRRTYIYKVYISLQRWYRYQTKYKNCAFNILSENLYILHLKKSIEYPISLKLLYSVYIFFFFSFFLFFFFIFAILNREQKGVFNLLNQHMIIFTYTIYVSVNFLYFCPFIFCILFYFLIFFSLIQ